MASPDVKKMEVDPPHLKKSAGVSIDLGSSLLKLVYITKDGKNPKTGHLGLTTFPSSDLDRAIQFIKDHCSLTGQGGPDGVPLVYVTGINNEETAKKLETSLNVRIVNLPKSQCFARGFAYMGRTAGLSAHLETNLMDHKHEIDALVPMMEMMVEHGVHTMEFHFDAVKDLAKKSPEELYAMSVLTQSRVSAFPCLLVVCGSTYNFLKVYENGDYEFLDTANGGNALFTIFGSLLSGSKTPQELNKLAEDGDPRQVDIGMFDYKEKMTGSDDVYGQLINEDIVDQVIFCFGKAPGKKRDDFKREDMTSALLQVVAMELADATWGVALRGGFKDVVFCGSFVNSTLTRKLVAAWITKKKIQLVGYIRKGENFNVHFLRHGSHIGALGALVSSLEDPHKANVHVDELANQTLALVL